jgi:hypothetical protein
MSTIILYVYRKGGIELGGLEREGCKEIKESNEGTLGSRRARLGSRKGRMG